MTVTGASVRADGLIYRLPRGGAWVRYDIQMKSTQKMEGKQPRKLKGRGTLLLSSVGREKVDGELCRWIEIAFDMSPAGTPKKFSRVLKVLIPEKRLKRGQDPFAHVRDMYYSQGGLLDEVPIERITQSEKITGADYSRRQYELDRLRSVFPPIMKDVRNERESAKSKLGQLECKKLSGTANLSKSPLRGGGEWAWHGEFQCLLNDKVPFGVVSLCSRVKGFEKAGETVQFKTEYVLTVREVGQDATTQLNTSK